VKPNARTAAVILAAGKSSRMGVIKPLLPLGSGSVIERVIRSVSQASVSDILIVTGHNSEEMAPVLDGLGVHHVHNADYETGMFSSVRAGVKALTDDVDAFFVLPVDCPLIQPGVLDRLIRSRDETQSGISYPSCCGLRGHPPLISIRYRGALLLADNRGNLQSFLERHADDAVEVDVEDPTILMDMDTPEEYQRVTRFAELIDSEDRSPGIQHACPTSEDALYLLSLLEVPEHVIRHSRSVMVVGEALAAALKNRMPDLDVDLVRSACLLHDLARTQRKHAVVGQNILNSLRLCRLASIVGSHMLVPREILESPLLTEDELVYLADKLVIEDKVVSLDERTAHALREHGRDAASVEGVRTKMRTAHIISEKLESILGKAVTDCSFGD
jgi:molybdenum cofactor cytidylyltransferase